MSNRLSRATSPYLLQHQDNPVHWWEWQSEAFAEARRRDVPVLLSVGYAACHWCHVMAHESFEDPATARLMNEHFVNIKVDREERPDVDTVYMEAVQAMTGRGGWPMTVWMDHDGRPFYAGTYYPKRPVGGMASFTQVLQSIAQAWDERRDEIHDQASRLTSAIDRGLPPGSTPGNSHLRSAYGSLASIHDAVNGGFGQAPKFPQQPVLAFLLATHHEPWAPNGASIVEHTLNTMARGGIRDHVGGGFARYSVDDEWLVPHFEKMLYDNAQLARLYLWAGVEFKRPDFTEVARTTISYMLTDLAHEGGGFYSAEDADSEGVEGKFYVWSREELESLVVEPDLIEYLGVEGTPNFEGSYILTAQSLEAPTNWENTRQRLLEYRNQRVRPALDDKIVTAWNGLTIQTLVEAGAVLKDPALITAAEQSAEFIWDNLRVEGTLYRSWRRGRVSAPAFLDDHAALAIAYFALYSATGARRWFSRAMTLVDNLSDFDAENGGFYLGSQDDLFKRASHFTDNPHPSGSGLAVEALTLATRFTGESRYLERAERALAAVEVALSNHPSMVAHHLTVFYGWSVAREVAVVGPKWGDFAAVFWSRHRPGSVFAGSEEGEPEIPLLADRRPGTGTTAYVCRGFVCDLPTTDIADFSTQLAGMFDPD